MLALVKILASGFVPTLACVDGRDEQQCEALPSAALQRRQAHASTQTHTTESLLLQSRAEAVVHSPVPAHPLPSVEVMDAPRLPLALCDPVIVDDTCLKLGGSVENRSVRWATLTTLLSADSLAPIQAVLGLPENFPTVGCHELCSKVIEYVRNSGNVLPPWSDVACRTVRGNTTCDVDVFPDEWMHSLGKVKNEELPDEEGLRIVSSVNLEDEGTGSRLQQTAPHHNTAARHELANSTHEVSMFEPLHYTRWAAVDRLANLFRIFPSRRQALQVSLPQLLLLQESGDLRTQDTQVEGVLATREVQAKAWLATILRELNGQRAAQFRAKWFGGAGSLSAEEVKQRVLKTMNFMEEEFSKGMRYVYPADVAAGTICQGNIVAYVWRNGWEKDRGYDETIYPVCRRGDDVFSRSCGVDQNGKYFVYLCKRWYEGISPDSQVALLIHEAAHHSGPADVTYNSAQMRRNTQADQLNNAANYQQFAFDVWQNAPSAPPPAPQPAAPKGCDDLYAHCQYYKDNGFCKDPNDNIGQQCTRTCGFCTSEQPRPAPTPVTPTGDCKDLYSSCQYYKDQGFCKDPNDNVGQQCKKTCGFCVSVPAPTPPAAICQDTYGACQYYKDTGLCTDSNNNVGRVCKKTCGFC